MLGCALNMEPKVNIALEAARAGCKELLSFAYRLDQLEIKEKGPSNFVTQLDKKVESIIIELRKSFYESMREHFRSKEHDEQKELYIEKFEPDSDDLDEDVEDYKPPNHDLPNMISIEERIAKVTSSENSSWNFEYGRYSTTVVRFVFT